MYCRDVCGELPQAEDGGWPALHGSLAILGVRPMTLAEAPLAPGGFRCALAVLWP